MTDNYKSISILLDDKDNIKYVVDNPELENKLRIYHKVNDDYTLKTIKMDLNRIFPLTNSDLDPHDKVYKHTVVVYDTGEYKYRGVQLKETNKHFSNSVEINVAYSPSSFNIEPKYIIKIYRYFEEEMINGKPDTEKVMDIAIKEMTEYKLRHIDEVW